MAVINSIRKRSGLLLTIVLIGVVLFILGDFISGQFRAKKQERIVGEVAGESISAETFSQAVKKLEDRFTLFNNRRPQENEKEQMKEQAWNQVLFNTVYAKEFEKLGIKVTKSVDGEDNEENDMLTGGRTMDPSLRSAPVFRNQQTGQFDLNRLNQFLGAIQNPQNEEQYMMRAQWIASSEQMYEQRHRQKYESLLSKSAYITAAESEQEYNASEKSGVFNYVYVPLSTVSDTLINVQDNDLEDYLDKHENEFKVDENRTIDYVLFPISPREEDEERTKKDVDVLTAQFKDNGNDTTFAKAKTDPGTGAVGKYAKDELPSSIENESLVKGNVYGPYFQAGGVYKLFKYVGRINDTSFTKPQASHILLSTQGADETQKAEKEAQAQDLLARLKKGENFVALAFQFSDDPGSKQKGGDLGEFGRGQMVPQFEEAVFNAKKTGVVPELVETQFGYHIINVTKKVSVEDIVKKNVFAEITRAIVAGKNTRNSIYRSASSFVRSCNESNDFDATVDADPSLTKIKGIKVYPNSKFVGSLGEAKEVVTWAYQQEEEGEVSKLMKLDNKYVVVTVSEVIKANELTVDNLRDQLKVKVVNEKKAELIKEKLSSYSGSLATIKDSYNNAHGSDLAKVEEGIDLTLSSSSLGSSGFDPKAIGAAFSTTAGQQSPVIVGENGAYVFEAVSIEEPKEVADYKTYKGRLASPQAANAGFKADQALRKLSDVDDKRYLFF